MTGASIRYDISIEDRAARRELDGVERRARDLSPAMDEIGSMLVASTLNRFETGTGPDGIAWLPSQRVLKQGGQTLVDSARLRDSQHHVFGADFVEVGSNVLYAAIHQLGGRAGRGGAANIPARPFLGIDAGDEAEIINILTAHIGGLQ
ncbi:MAG: phage virion morphogenesis protein [Rhodospirillales bacterium]|nr:phage virion morphogenesis protein [Rhodospirillales bacterium]